jgi:Fur family ferric uptake transcriptional regulator
MTTARSIQPLLVDSLDEAIIELRARGLRISSARRLVLDVLFAADRPVSADEIADGLGRLPPLDLTSVYRNLEMLEDVGLVRHVHLGHGPGLYTLAATDEEGYLVCDSCGEVRRLEQGALDEIKLAIRSASGYEPRFTHFPLTGLCPACVAEADDD